MALAQISTKWGFDVKLDAKRTEVWRVQANICTRVYARMSLFLLADRERDSDRGKPRFPLVNRLFFEMKRNVLKSTISES
jgi:hypothetical protein